MPKGNSRYDTEHLRNISAYQRQIDEIFKAADEEAARIAKASGAKYDPDRPFSFDDYPSVKKRVDRMTSDLASRVERTIVNGIKAQWELSNRKNDDLVETVTGLKADDLPADRRRRWFGTNESARDAFIRRETEGMNLSEEVWRFRRETEFGIDLSLKGLQDRMERGLSEGVSAADMSRELRGYLKNPDKLFRRVRDERGNLTLSRNARLFHPGQGVYRSSYMNARRLAATETNMAYRSADHERWKSLDFVVGIEIQTSNNHTTKDGKGNTVELEDICDTLAGRYPKGFKFVGWHPHCRCIATAILKTEEEMEADTERMLNGEEPLSPSSSENYEGNLPDKFTNWLDTNSERIENAKSLPYFLKDNQKLIEEGGAGKLSALEVAERRHAARTAEEIGDIKERWTDRAVGLGEDALSVAKDHGDADLTGLEKALADRDVEEILKQTNAVGLAVEKALSDIIPDAHRWHGKYTLKELDEVHDFLKDSYDSLSSEPYREQIEGLRGALDSFNVKGDPFVEDIKGRYAAWEVIPDAMRGKIAEVETMAHTSFEEIRREYRSLVGNEESYQEWNKFDYVSVKRSLEDILESHGLKLGGSTVNFSKEEVVISFKTTKDEVKILRTFKKRDDGSIEVHHDLFNIVLAYRGEGISKEVIRMMYGEYKRLGVRYISVMANLDVGGYTWARYGFKANSRYEIDNVINISNARADIKNRAMTFIDNFYKNHPSDKPFPMNELIEYIGREDAKLLLLDTWWNGILDLSDKERREIFESYMGYKEE